MADDFGDLGTSVEVDEDILSEKLAIDKIFFNCYNTPEGKRMIDYMASRHVETPIYLKGDTLELTSYRQGMSDVVTQIYKAVSDVVEPHRK